MRDWLFSGSPTCGSTDKPRFRRPNDPVPRHVNVAYAFERGREAGLSRREDLGSVAQTQTARAACPRLIEDKDDRVSQWHDSMEEIDRVVLPNLLAVRYQ